MSANAADRDPPSSNGFGTVLRTVAVNCWRTLLDFVIVGLWVAFLAFVFLSVDYPRWAFYTLLVLGVILYTQLSPGWRRAGDSDGPNDG